MKKLKKRCSVYTALKKNEAGFTFISILLSFMIILTTLPILAYFISHTNQSDNDTQITVEQFFSFIQYDRDAAISVTSDSHHIYFLLPEGEIATIEQYEQLIRRKVDAKGHEIYIRDIDSFDIQNWEHGFSIQLTMLNGEKYEKKFAAK